MGRPLGVADRATLPAGTLAVLVRADHVGPDLKDWRKGDVCMFERDGVSWRAQGTAWRNLRTGQVTDRPAMGRFALLEDKADD